MIAAAVTLRERERKVKNLDKQKNENKHFFDLAKVVSKVVGGQNETRVDQNSGLGIQNTSYKIF